MKNNWTIKKLFEEFCRIEVEYKLFECEVDGVFFWKLIRFTLFMELSKKLNLHQDAHPYPKQSGNRYVRFLNRLVNGTFNGPMSGRQNVDIILFPHARKVNVESELIDIYSYYFETYWKKHGIDYLVIERAYNGKFIRKSSKIVKYDELLSIFSLLRYFKSKKDMNIDFVMNGIDAIANIPIEKITTLSKKSILGAINNFKREYDYYTRILLKYSPKEIYIVYAYGKSSLLAAANDLNIDTIEIQHGTITSFHTGYSYPPEVNVPYFPKKLKLWGKFWYDISQLPIDEKNISYDGFHFLHKEVPKYSNTIKDKSRVLFISQGTIGKPLVNIALELARKNKEFKVVYRLHPSELGKWKVLYPELYSFSIKTDNIIIETGIDTPLYKSFAESMFVVGVYSTALIESLSVNCNLILIDLPGVEFFQDLVNKKLVQKVRTFEQLVRVLKIDGKSDITDSNYFFGNLKK